MKGNVKMICTITFVIVGLVLASGATAMTSKKQSIQDGEYAFTVVKSKPMKLMKPVTTTKTLSSSQVTSDLYNDYHPSIAASPAGSFYAMAESSADGTGWSPGIYQSDATGATWENIIQFISLGRYLPALDSNSVGTYGTFAANSEETEPNNASQIPYFQIETIGESVPVFQFYDTTYGITNLFNIDINCYNDPNESSAANGWNIALTGSMNTGDGVPFILYVQPSPNEDGGIIGWVQDRYGYENVANAADQQKLLTYNVYDRTDGTDLFVRVVNVGKWNYYPAYDMYTRPDKKTVTIKETQFQVKYPSVAARNDTVMIVAQKINGTQNDIICYHSSNGLSKYNRTIVVNSTDNETYPQIVMTGKTTAVCTYTKNNILYFKKTNDSGATWGPETQVSDSQVQNEYRNQGLCTKQGDTYAAWEDTRTTDNTDIYFDLVTKGPPAPILNITEIKGGIGVSATVKNVGGATATNVKCTITVTGGFLKRVDVHKEGTQATLAAGDDFTTKTDMFLGLGPLTIDVTATADEGISTHRATTGFLWFFFATAKN